MAGRHIAVALAMCALAMTACTQEPAVPPKPPISQYRRAETAQQIAARLKLTITGEIESDETVVPESFDDGAWYYYQVAAVQGGYDLRPHRGERVTMRGYGIRELSDGHRQTLWVIESGSEVIGAYISVDDLLGGVSGVGNPQ